MTQNYSKNQIPTSDIILLGAGGHAKVVIDCLTLQYPDAKIVIQDDDSRLQGHELNGLGIQTPIDFTQCHERYIHIAIGNNQIRERLLQRLGESNILLTVCHPRSTIASSSIISDGVLLAAGCIVGPDAVIGPCSIINHNAVVDHDCVIGRCCHIAPNATIGGNVEVGNGSLIGSGAVVLPGVKIGNNVQVGAGAVVTTNIPADQTVKGVPAK